jgi:hypothetical protein
MLSSGHVNSSGAGERRSEVVGEWRGRKACYAYLGDALHLSLSSQVWRGTTFGSFIQIPTPLMRHDSASARLSTS